MKIMNMSRAFRRRSAAPQVRDFNQFDLYSKSDERPNLEKLWPYYQDLIDKYLPGELMWWDGPIFRHGGIFKGVASGHQNAACSATLVILPVWSSSGKGHWHPGQPSTQLEMQQLELRFCGTALRLAARFSNDASCDWRSSPELYALPLVHATGALYCTSHRQQAVLYLNCRYSVYTPNTIAVHQIVSYSAQKIEDFVGREQIAPP
jgi:hypothetical protein